MLAGLKLVVDGSNSALFEHNWNRSQYAPTCELSGAIPRDDALGWHAGHLPKIAITQAGTTAIKTMGGPISQYCAGRIDSPDGGEGITGFLKNRCQLVPWRHGEPGSGPKPGAGVESHFSRCLLGLPLRQELYAPCIVNGTCQRPLGSTTVPCQKGSFNIQQSWCLSARPSCQQS